MRKLGIVMAVRIVATAGALITSAYAQERKMTPQKAIDYAYTMSKDCGKANETVYDKDASADQKREAEETLLACAQRMFGELSIYMEDIAALTSTAQMIIDAIKALADVIGKSPRQAPR